MRLALALAALVGLLVPAASTQTPEPLAGLWRLQQQEVDGQANAVEPLTLRIVQVGDRFTFTFSVPLPDIYFVTMTYTLRLDGSTADITNANGETVGTIQMTRSGARRYVLTMKGPNRPSSHGTLTVSADGKTLVSEADASQSGRSIHSKQTFVRR